MRATLLLALTLFACDHTPQVTVTSAPLPSHVGEYQRTDGASAAGQITRFFSYDTNFADHVGSEPGDAERLYIEVGQPVPGGYHATQLVTARLHSPTFGDAYYAPIDRCVGTATLQNDTWTFAFSGPAACARWNGSFADRPPAPPAYATERPEVRPLELVLSADNYAARALRSVPPYTLSMDLPNTPCPIQLAHVDEATASGSAVGDSVVRNHDAYRASGQPFALTTVESGQPIHGDPSSQLRFQVVYVRTLFQRPVVDRQRRQFRPGLSAGRAYLIDRELEHLLCIADVRASNGDTIESDGADTWLLAQLNLAVERSVALGLRDIRRARTPRPSIPGLDQGK